MGRFNFLRRATSVAILFALGGCRAIVGVEDLTVADGGADGASFAQCRTTCTTQNAPGESAFFSNLDNCLCVDKTARVCGPECNNYCDKMGSPPEACRACVLPFVASGALTCAGSCGGGTCATFVSCIKTCK